MSEHGEEAVVDEVEEVVLAPGIYVEQHSPTRVTFHILKEVWDGVAEVGRVEVDVARHLDPRVSITCCGSTSARRGRSR